MTDQGSHVTLRGVKVTQSIRQSGWGLAIGVAATAAVVGLHVGGLLDRFELDLLDLRFRHFNRVGPSDRIVHVGIGDDALERIHRWPWPRRLHAQLIDTLQLLGARAVVMDIGFHERQRPRAVLEYTDSPGELAKALARLQPDQAVLDDLELARAIARAGNVYLAMFYEPASEGTPAAGIAALLRGMLERDPTSSTRELLDRAMAEPSARDTRREDLETLCRRVHLGWLLERRFASSVDDLAGQTGLDRGEVDKVLPGLKRSVAQRLVRRQLEGRPDLTVDALIASILPDLPRDLLDERDIQAAYDTERSIRAGLRRTASIAADRQWLYPAAGAITPPLETMADAARDSGFVVFETGSIDGVVREIPLVACYRGRMLRQLAFAVLCDVLDVPPEGAEIVEPGRLVIHGARHPGESARRDLVLALDQRGRFLLNWYRGRGGWEESFRHLAVGRVLEIPRNREAAHVARKRTLAAAVEFTTARGAAATYEKYVDLAQTRDKAERELAWCEADDPNRPHRVRAMDETVKRMAEIERRAVGVIQSSYEEIRDLKPEDDQERREFEQIRQIHHDLSRIEHLKRRVEQRVAELKPEVEGKVCFVGYTATAVADFVSTPAFEHRVPGVVAHANLFHTLYAGASVRRAPGWLNVLLIVGCGLITSIITTRRGPIFSLLTAAVSLNGVIVAAALLLFYQWYIWIVVPAVVVAVLASWALITVYRQLTEGREKRLAFSRLGQYTSPTLARRIAEDPQALSRAEAREVTCYFSDLKGFTSISERLGPERTQALLNAYLERMSEVLDRHEAFINKFLGDGIFAFFNPALNPQPDHVRLACEAALDSLSALDELIAEQRGSGGDEAFQELRVRIGLATGSVVVGNCGSARKFDYTCIGDTVNLAARLESANKAFGTQIMASELTRRAADERYAWRYLGGLQVVGKREMVRVYECLGRTGTVSDERLELAARFEEGVRLFQEGRWVDCITHFTRMLARRPDDLGLMLYIDACQQYERFGPPDDDWSGAIELTEK